MFVKKILTLLPLSATLFLSSCLDSGGDTTMSSGYTVLNLVTPVDVAQPVSVFETTYRFDYNISKQTLSLLASELPVGSGTLSFTTPEVPYSNQNQTGGQSQRFSCVSSPATGVVSTIDNLQGVITTSVVNPRVYNITPITSVGQSPYFNSAFLMNYRAADSYYIYTFPSDAYFKGRTESTYPLGGSVQSFETEDCIYRAAIDIKSGKADIVLHNAQFTPPGEHAMPKLTFVLKDLTFTPVRGGYEITGTDIVPQVLEGTQLTPNPAFPFKRIALKTTNASMTSVAIEFEVEAAYGSFTGSFVGSMLVD